MIRVRRKMAAALAAAVLALGIATAVPAGAAIAAPRLQAAASPYCSGHSFLWIDGAYPHCFFYTGTYVVTGSGPMGTFVNNTGDRVWLHQNADGSGWAVCLGHGMVYITAGGTVYQNPGNVQITTNTAICGPPANTLMASMCPTFNAMAYLEGGPSVGGFCYYPSTTTTVNGSYTVLTNGSGYRVWLHQNADGSGWADCFSNNGVYNIYGTRDAAPGNIYVSTNTAPC